MNHTVSHEMDLIHRHISDSEPIKANEYFGIGRVTEFKYGQFLSDAFHGNNQLKYLKNFGEGWGMMPNGNALVFIDNHDNQRGHGGGGAHLTFREPKAYKVEIPSIFSHADLRYSL